MPVPSSYNDLTESIADREHYGWVFYQKKAGMELRRLCDEPEPPACTGQQEGNLHPRPQAETGGTLFPGEMASDSGF